MRIKESQAPMSTTTDDDTPAALDLRLQAHIGRKLREYYTGISAQPVPDRFKALLDQLESREAQAGDVADAANAVPRAGAMSDNSDDGATEHGR
jgi:hypothetical protein